MLKRIKDNLMLTRLSARGYTYGATLAVIFTLVTILAYEFGGLWAAIAVAFLKPIIYYEVNAWLYRLHDHKEKHRRAKRNGKHTIKSKSKRS